MDESNIELRRYCHLNHVLEVSVMVMNNFLYRSESYKYNVASLNRYVDSQSINYEVMNVDHQKIGPSLSIDNYISDEYIKS